MEDVAPSGSEGSLGTCVPRQDKVGGCLATLGRTKKGARQDKKWRLGRTKMGARHGRWMSPSPQVKGLSLLFYPSC
jgi:hypothetical protein